MMFWHVPAPNEALLISGSKRRQHDTQDTLRKSAAAAVPDSEPHSAEPDPAAAGAIRS
ncbi:MAG: hypothetical protein ABJB47_08635 [Actinomycetota bacterium]